MATPDLSVKNSLVTEFGFCYFGKKKKEFSAQDYYNAVSIHAVSYSFK